MAVLVKNESGSDYRFSGHSNQKLFPAGATMLISDDEWDSVITGKRGPGQLNPQPMPIAGSFTADPPAPLATRLDDVGGGVFYVGEAQPGTATSDPLWRIKKVTEIGPDLIVQWADGVNTFTKKWDERLTYPYS